MPIDTSIIEKIKKLNALAENAGTEAEAANAAARIAELCRKHNLELGSVLIEQKQKTATEKDYVAPGSIFPSHWISLTEACKLLFDVGSYVSKENHLEKDRGGEIVGIETTCRLVFFGLEANAEASVLTFNYLVPSVEAMLRGYAASLQKPLGRTGNHSFRLGCARRIKVEAKKLADAGHEHLQGSIESLALVRIQHQLVTEHLQKLNIPQLTRRPTVSNTGAFVAGYKAGGRVDLHGARTSRLLT